MLRSPLPEKWLAPVASTQPPTQSHTHLPQPADPTYPTYFVWRQLPTKPQMPKHTHIQIYRHIYIQTHSHRSVSETHMYNLCVSGISVTQDRTVDMRSFRVKKDQTCVYQGSYKSVNTNVKFRLAIWLHWEKDQGFNSVTWKFCNVVRGLPKEHLMLTLSLILIMRNSRQLPSTLLMFSKELKNSFETEPLASMSLLFHKCLITQINVKILPFSNILWIYPVVWPILVFRYTCKALLKTHLACWALHSGILLWLWSFTIKKIDAFESQSLQTFIRFSLSEHCFGKINALLTALTNSDLWRPCALDFSQTEMGGMKIRVTRSETLMSEETLCSKNSSSFFFLCDIAIVLALV